MIYNFAYKVNSNNKTISIRAANLHNACDEMIVFIYQQCNSVIVDSEVLIHNNDGRITGNESLFDIEHGILDYVE
jgi:hypothetical protein